MLYVRDLMTKNPITVTPDTPLRDVMTLMKRHKCRQIPVVQDESLIGIITDRDVRLVVDSPLLGHDHWQHQDPLDEVTVAACMTPNPLTVTPDTSVYKVAEMLGVYKFGAIPVVSEGRQPIIRLAGIVTVTDLLQHLATLGAGVPGAEPATDFHA